MKAIDLKTNYRFNPLGIDEAAPLLSWKCEGGVKQRFFRVIAQDEDGNTVFDSGKAESDRMNCRYGGSTKMAQRITWQVTLWDGETEETSEEAWFEMGLLSDADRKASWICGVDTNKKDRLPADCYRKTFVLRDEVKKARLYATACGVYKAEINGMRLPGILAPGTTEYSKHLYYQTYDVTEYLTENNTLDIAVGDGWYGDAQVFIGTASYFVDTMAFFRKWLRDLRDTQRKDGRVANVSPSAHPFHDREPLGGAAGWADAAVIVPYTLWKRYGDDNIIRDNLELMLGWANYVRKAAKDKLMKHLPIPSPFNKVYKPYYVSKSPYEKYVIESGMHWGEWLEPDIDSISEQQQPKPELTTAYAHHSMGLLAEMLRSIGKNKEAADCDAFAQGAKQAYNYYFVKDGKIRVPRQAPMVRALALGLLSEEDAIKVAADLNQNAIDRNYTVGTGFLSTPFVLGILTKYGYVDTAYKMLENTKAPGWLAMVEQGATTVWEVYHIFDENGHPKASSMNHYSPGAVCGFLFDTICGIQVDGDNHFRIAPVPGGTLNHAKASYRSPYGLVESSWERQGNNTKYTITIPANCTAEVVLPGGARRIISAGCHEMEEVNV